MPGYAPPSPTRRTRRPVNVPSRLQPSSTYWIWPRLCDSASMSSLRVAAHTTGRCSRCAAAATTICSGYMPALPPKPPPTNGVTTRISLVSTPSARGQQVVQEVRHLRGAVDEQASVVGDRRRCAVRLHRRDCDALVDVPATHDHVGVAEQTVVDRIGGTDRDVVAVCLEQHRRVDLERGFRGHDCRQHLVVDDHHVGCVFGLHRGFGDHRDDRVADEAHAVSRQRWAGEVVVHGDHALERADPEVCGSQNGNDTWRRLRCLDVDTGDQA